MSNWKFVVWRTGWPSGSGSRPPNLQSCSRVSQKTRFWPCMLANKCKVICHARNTLTKDGTSPLSFRPPRPPEGQRPLVRSKIQNCPTKLIVRSFESSWRGKLTWAIHNALLQIFWKIQTKNKAAVLVIPFPVNISKGIVNRAFWLIWSLFLSSRAFQWVYDELCTTA